MAGADGQRDRALAARRELLLARSARLRAELGAAAADLARPLGTVDRALAWLRSDRSRAPLAAGALVAAAALGPRRLLRLARHALVAAPLLARLLPRRPAP